MIKGIGIDIVDIARIEAIMKRNPRFIEKILSVKEQEKYQALMTDSRRTEFVAGRFAAKEALGKALGTGLGTLNFCDIVILNEVSGKPTLHFPGDDLYQRHISISHSQTSAVANIVLESKHNLQ